MRIDNSLNSGRIFQPEQYEKLETENSVPSFAPCSWGNDTVSFSAEALAKANEQAASPEGEKMSATEEFQAYMTGKRSRAQGGGSIEEQIKKLEEQASQVSSKIAQVAGSKSMPEGVKDSQLQNLSAQLQDIMAQIDSLKKLGGGETAEA